MTFKLQDIFKRKTPDDNIPPTSIAEDIHTLTDPNASTSDKGYTISFLETYLNNPEAYGIIPEELPALTEAVVALAQNEDAPHFLREKTLPVLAQLTHLGQLEAADYVTLYNEIQEGQGTKIALVPYN